MLKAVSCEHLENYEHTDPQSYACEECIKCGDRWVHLRTCQTCGVTLCCDSSPKQHASKHAKAKGHPVIISTEPKEYWAYCYVDDRLKSWK